MTIIDILGWLGSALLASCGLPQVWTTYRTKTVKGLSLAMLLTWHFGGLFMLIYICVVAPALPVIVNYALNAVSTTSLLVMYWMYRNNK